MEKVTYKCKCCGWQKAIPAAWADVSPRFCGENTCEYSIKKGKGKKSFKSNPDMLEKVMPVVKPKQEERPSKTPQGKVRGRKKK